MPRKHAARRIADPPKDAEETVSDTAVDTPVVVHERVQFDISEASTTDAHEPTAVIKRRRRRSICLPRKHASRKKNLNAKVNEVNIYGSPPSSLQQDSLPRTSQQNHIPVSLEAEPVVMEDFILWEETGSDCMDTAASKVDLLEVTGEFTDLDGHSAHQFFVIDESGIYEHSPTEDPDDVLLEKSDSAFKNLLSSLRNASLPHDFVVVRGSSEDIVISDHYKSDDALSVRMSVILYPSKTTKVIVHRREARIPVSAPGIDFTVKFIVNFLDYLCELSVCMGNPDDDMQPFIPTVGGVLSSQKGPVIGYKEGDFMVKIGDVRYSSTIRHDDCTMLVRGARCDQCQHLRHILRSRRDRKRQSEQTPPTRKAYARMTSEECRLKLGLLNKDNRRLSRQVTSMSERIADLEMKFRQVIVREGESLPAHQNEEVASLVEDCKSEFEKASPPPQFLSAMLLGGTTPVQPTEQ